MKKFLGIDLGTSNSAVSVFKDASANVLFNTLGQLNTPSVLRVTEQGIVVGERAKRYLHTDSKNTFKEFKRLMGTESLTDADSNGKQWSADELSSIIIKELKDLAEEQEQCNFDKVVITVPALFELPQSKATANAARLAGFDKVELLPEPVASALASGWEAQNNDSAWLVYDLGGGTFDASLLESRDGLLRVVAHDGDNFLGGRDIDKIIVEWIKEKISADHKVSWEKDPEEYLAIARQLEAEAEKAKIRLSQAPRTVIEIDINIDNQLIQTDLAFTVSDLNQLCEPIIQKTTAICLRLLASQGMALHQLERVVLVGGPAHMPIIQNRIEQELAPIAKINIDPMALVAQGAALYSATLGLECGTNKPQDTSNDTANDFQVWLQFPSICSELNPMIMGRIIDDNFRPHSIQLCSPDSTWKSPPFVLNGDDIFLIEANVLPSKKNSFYLQAFTQTNSPIKVIHPQIHIVHGLAMSDPPLSRSVGVALADGTVKKFIERGTPLPAKRTFLQSTIDTLNPKTKERLIIPITQGERRKARFCRNVGQLIINAQDLKQVLPVASSIEITIEIDRGGDLKAQAFIPDQNKLIEGVANLVIEETSIESLNALSQELNVKINNRMHSAFRDRDNLVISALEPLIQQFNNFQAQLTNISDDVDECLRLSRNLMDIEAEFEQVETQDYIAELLEECEQHYYSASRSVDNYGDEADKRILAECAKSLEHVFAHKRQNELERLIERLTDLNHSAHRKSPKFYQDVFYHWASYAQHATNLKRANQLVEKGHQLVDMEKYAELAPIANELYTLIPQKYRNSSDTNYDSGIF